MTSPAEDIDRYRQLLEDLRPVNVRLYFGDTALWAAVGWTLFALAVAWPLPTWGRFVGLVAAAACLYRALAFIHELFHQQSMTNYRHFWHLVAGVPLLVPLLLYLPIHQGHHASGTYGTPHDGEYEQFRGRARAMAAKLLALNLALPLALLVRFAVLTPLGAVMPFFRREVIPSFVHLSLRLPFRAPDIKGPTAREAMRVEWACAGFAWLLIGAAWSGHAQWLCGWAVTIALVATLNTVRALCSTHLYVEQAEGRGPMGQVADSLNVAPGGWLTWLLCPAGLQFHALHHLAPYLPYHALPEAHARLMACGPDDSVYRRSTVPCLASGWRRLARATR